MKLDELVSEEKKLKSQKIIIAVLIGFVIGIAVWAATHKGGFYLTIILGNGKVVTERLGI